jgi:hypothetical protein
MHDTLEPYLLGGKDRKGVEVHLKLGLGTEDPESIYAGSILLPLALFEDKSQQVEVLFVHLVVEHYHFGARYIRMYRRAAVYADFIAFSILMLGSIYGWIRLEAVFTDLR